MSEHKPSYLLVILLVLIVTNLIILNINVFSLPQIFKLSQLQTKITPTSLPKPTSSLISSSSCPTSCINMIKQANLNTTTKIGTSFQTPLTSSVNREFFIPLGSGSTSKQYWDDIISTETIIDLSNYGSVKQTIVSYALRNPTQNGRIEAQLYNVTDDHPVWGSHGVMDGEEKQTINTGGIILENSPKLYRVQLKSSLSYPVYLDGAKIKINSE